MPRKRRFGVSNEINVLRYFRGTFYTNLGRASDSGEYRNLWGNVNLAFQATRAGRCWGFVDVSDHSSEYVLDQDRPPRHQPHDLAPATDQWEHLHS